ncbi:hypothetical protein ACJX0J_037255, partial [Zea mays]
VFLHTKFGASTGTSLWLGCDRGATSCNADTNGVLSHGIWTPSESGEEIIRGDEMLPKSIVAEASLR